MAEEDLTFSQRLSACLESKGVTQEEIASKIGVGQSAIANLINRNCRPQRKTVLRLADALGVPPQDLWPNFKPD